MRKILFEIIFPAFLITLWLTVCIPICRRGEGIDYFFLWILAGFPFGVRRMFLWLIPRGFTLSGTVGIVAFNLCLGGLIGGVVLVAKIIRIFINCILLLTGRFWKLNPKG